MASDDEFSAGREAERASPGAKPKRSREAAFHHELGELTNPKREIKRIVDDCARDDRMARRRNEGVDMLAGLPYGDLSTYYSDEEIAGVHEYEARAKRQLRNVHRAKKLLAPALIPHLEHLQGEPQLEDKETIAGMIAAQMLTVESFAEMRKQTALLMDLYGHRQTIVHHRISDETALDARVKHITATVRDRTDELEAEEAEREENPPPEADSGEE